MRDRILLFLKYLCIGQTKFEKNVGLSNGFISKSSGNIGIKAINKILDTYPQLNRDWLLFGQGEMLNEMQIIQKYGNVVNSSSGNIVNSRGARNIAIGGMTGKGGIKIDSNSGISDEITLEIISNYKELIDSQQKQISELLNIIKNLTQS